VETASSSAPTRISSGRCRPRDTAAGTTTWLSYVNVCPSVLGRIAALARYGFLLVFFADPRQFREMQTGRYGGWNDDMVLVRTSVVNTQAVARIT